MILASLRASKRDWNLERFLESQRVPASAIWHQGEVRSHGGTHLDSGFSIEFDESSLLGEVREVFEDLFAGDDLLLGALRAERVDVELDLGVTVGEEESYAPVLEFPVEFLATLVEYRVKLRVSAYPTSDE